MRRAALASVVAGCVLLVAAAAQALVPAFSASGAPGATLAPSVEVSATLPRVAQNGQTTGFAVASDGSLGIVDRSTQQVLRLQPNGTALASWGPRFGDTGDAQDLMGLAVHGEDWYVLDRGRAQILHLDSSGNLLQTIDLQPFGTYGPNGLATDAHGNVYLADTGGNRILVFSSNGAFVRSVGTAGTELGQLKQPIGVTFGPDGAMYVADFENSRIERFSPGGQATDAWPVPAHPWSAAVDALGRVFVPDLESRLVRTYSTHGDLLATIPDLPLDAPTQVALSPDGSALWVLGSDALARLDLAPLAQIVPQQRAPVGAGWLVPVGLTLTLMGGGLAALARRRGQVPSGLSRAPSGVSRVPSGVSRVPFGVRRAPAPAARPAPAAEPAAAAEPAPAAEPTPATERPTLTHAVPLRRTTALALTAVGACVLATAALLLAIGTPSGKAEPWPLLAGLLLCGIAWAAACALSAGGLTWRWLCTQHTETARCGVDAPWRRWAAIIGLVLACGAAVLWWTGHFETIEATRAAWLWLAGIVLVAASVTHLTRPPRRDLLLIALLVALALAPRLWDVADLPYGVWFDEAQGAVEIRRVVQAGTYAPILNTYGRDTSGFFYIMPALWPLVGDGILSARGAAALVGAANVAAMYLLGRELFGWRVGLAAGVLLACMRWHLNFSRLGFNPVSLPFAATLTFWLLARAIRRRTVTDAVWAGLALGVGLHAYTGFRGTALVALALFAWLVLLRRVPRTAFGAYVGAAVLVALPVLVFALQDPAAFNGRTAQTLILNQPAEIWGNLQRHLLMFQVSGDMNGRHNLPGAPMLDPLTGGLLMLGLGWLLIRPFGWPSLMLLGWATISMLGGILTLAFEAPQAARTIGVTPVLALLAGLGLVATADRARAALSLASVRRVGLAIGALSLAVLGAAALINLQTYFGPQMSDPAVFAAFSTRETVPPRFVLAAPDAYDSVLASATMAPSVQADFLVPDRKYLIHPFDPVTNLPYRGNGPGLIFLETEHDQPLIDLVGQVYPEAPRIPIQAAGGGKPIVGGFMLAPETIAAHRGATVAYQGADGAQVERTENGVGLSAATAPVPLPAEVTWRTLLAIDATGEYAVRAPSGFSLEIDGAPMPEAVRVRLARGNHSLQLRGLLQPGATVGAEWKPVPTAAWEPLPLRSLLVPPGGGYGLEEALVAPGVAEDDSIDPVLAHYFHVSPYSRLAMDPPEWSITWRGLLYAPTTGTYSLTLDHTHTAQLFIDDQPTNGTLPLDAGPHPLRVTFDKTGGGAPFISLSWVPPGAPPGVIPSSFLSPPPPTVLGPAT